MKELVEHIRTVHFTVLVLTLALTAALQIEHRRPLERAAQDIDAILLTSQKWDQTTAALDEAIRKNNLDIVSTDEQAESDGMIWPKRGLTYSVELPSTHQRDGFNFMEPWIYIAQGDRGYASSFSPRTGDSYIAENRFPHWKTLREFVDIWDDVHASRAAVVPIALQLAVKSTAHCNDIKVDHQATPNTRVVFSPAPSPAGGWSITAGISSETSDVAYPQIRCSLGSVDLPAVPLDLGGALKPLAPQAGRWGTGTSQQEFPELIAASRFLEDAPLQNLAAALRDRANEDTERVEIFQAKLPASSIPTFGSIILILCELYLLAHLFELRKLLGAESSEWPSGYIGLYSNALIFSFTIITLTIFPLIPLIWSAARNTGSMRVLSIIACAISLILGVGCSWILFSIRRQHLIVSPDSLI